MEYGKNMGLEQWIFCAILVQRKNKFGCIDQKFFMDKAKNAVMKPWNRD